MSGLQKQMHFPQVLNGTSPSGAMDAKQSSPPQRSALGLDSSRGELAVLSDVEPSRTYRSPKREAQPSPSPQRKQRSQLDLSCAPNGQRWADVFQEADEWEASSTLGEARQPTRKPPSETQPRPWPTLPPPDDAQVHQTPRWQLALVGFALLSVVGLYLSS